MNGPPPGPALVEAAFDDTAAVERVAEAMWRAEQTTMVSSGSVRRAWDCANYGERFAWRDIARAALGELLALQREERAAKPMLFFRTSEPGVALSAEQMWQRIDAAETLVRAGRRFIFGNFVALRPSENPAWRVWTKDGHDTDGRDMTQGEAIAEARRRDAEDERGARR